MFMGVSMIVSDHKNVLEWWERKTFWQLSSGESACGNRIYVCYLVPGAIERG